MAGQPPNDTDWVVTGRTVFATVGSSFWELLNILRSVFHSAKLWMDNVSMWPSYALLSRDTMPLHFPYATTTKLRLAGALERSVIIPCGDATGPAPHSVLSSPVGVPVGVVGSIADSLAALLVLSSDDPRLHEVIQEGDVDGGGDEVEVVSSPPLHVAVAGKCCHATASTCVACASAMHYARVLVISYASTATITDLRSRADADWSVVVYVHKSPCAVLSLTDSPVVALQRADATLRPMHALLHGVDTNASQRVIVLRTRDQREAHVFWCENPEAHVANGNVVMFVRQCIANEHPIPGTSAGIWFAKALARSIDEVAGRAAAVDFSDDDPDGICCFRIAAGLVMPTDGGSVAHAVARAVHWRLHLEPVWPPEGDAEAAAMEAWGDVADAEAYVLDFAMDGVAGDAAALAAVEAQLEWGKGVRLEKRHGSAHERVTVQVTGPNRQVVHAETDLEEENVGEEGAMLRVRVAGDTGAVRLQFPPGQTNPDLVL